MCSIQRPKGGEEGGEGGRKQEGPAQKEQEAKEEGVREDGPGKEMAEPVHKERSGESGEEGKAQDAPEQGQEGEQSSKDDLQRSLSQDGYDDR